jgi:hypothetical protein
LQRGQRDGRWPRGEQAHQISIPENPYSCYANFWFSSVPPFRRPRWLAIKVPPRRNLGAQNRCGGKKKIWNRVQKLFWPHKPLIFHKTAKGIFGKIWRKGWKNLEKFAEKLGEICRKFGATAREGCRRVQRNGAVRR